MRVQAVSNQRKFYRFNKFRGVDYSSSPLEVKTNRATDMANLILRDGTLHKRNGFEQVHYLGGTEEIKGAWVFKRNAVKTVEGEQQELLCDFLIYVQGNEVYECNITLGYKAKKLYTGNNIDSRATAYEFSSPIYTLEEGQIGKEKRLYILCGEFLVYMRKEEDWGIYNLLDLGEEETFRVMYIPTTTTNILPTNTAITHKQEFIFESINALTKWRRNRLVYEKDDGNVKEYYLDGKIDNKSGFSPRLYFTKSDGTTEEVTFQLVYFNEGKQFKWESIQTWGEGDHTVDILGNRVYIPYQVMLDTGENTEDLYYEIIYPCKDVTPLSKIGSIGAIFGNDGRADRLFVEDGNFVRYSENTAEYLPDFTYFPVTNFVKCGQSGEITAFLRSANGTLTVFKDVDNEQEPSVYYISGTYVEHSTDATGEVIYDDAFNVTAGNIEEKCSSPYGIATLAGDSLFVSKTGVYGIELSGNVAADDRFARERSRIINAKLTKFDLAKAKAIVHDKRYYLAVGGDKDEVYVADARYSFTADGDEANTFNYEWFRWTDIPVSSWVEKSDGLWFISKDKYLCKFTDKYYDKYLTENGETVHDDEEVKEGKVFFDKALLPIVHRALYAEYENERWNVANIHNYGTEASPKYAFDAPEGQANGIVNLAFICPVKSYWKSAVTDLGSSVHRKNMYSLSVVAAPAKQSVVEIGYTTRLQDKMAMIAEGTSAFDFGDLSFEGYGDSDNVYQMFSFDAGGFISAYRQRVFERNFVYTQVVFGCNSIGDCIVEEIAMEYIQTIKNIGVG